MEKHKYDIEHKGLTMRREYNAPQIESLEYARPLTILAHFSIEGEFLEMDEMDVETVSSSGTSTTS